MVFILWFHYLCLWARVIPVYCALLEWCLLHMLTHIWYACCYPAHNALLYLYMHVGLYKLGNDLLLTTYPVSHPMVSYCDSIIYVCEQGVIPVLFCPARVMFITHVDTHNWYACCYPAHNALLYLYMHVGLYKLGIDLLLTTYPVSYPMVSYYDYIIYV